MANAPTVFHRRQLAAQFSNRILNVSPGSAAGSGLFLAAPRRTGKSTFVRENLCPQLERDGALVLYVDPRTASRAGLYTGRATEPKAP